MNSSPRGRGSDKVQPAPHLQHLSLPELRAYRHDLRAEEERVAYWRRLVQGRLHGVRTGTDSDRLDLDDLHRALGVTGSGARRSLLLDVTPVGPLPPLPSLDGAWAEPVTGADRTEASAALEEAATQLADYRAAVRDRLAMATNELITRYIADPEAAFDLTGEPGD